MATTIFLVFPYERLKHEPSEIHSLGILELYDCKTINMIQRYAGDKENLHLLYYRINSFLLCSISKNKVCAPTSKFFTGSRSPFHLIENSFDHKVFRLLLSEDCYEVETLCLTLKLHLNRLFENTIP